MWVEWIRARTHLALLALLTDIRLDVVSEVGLVLPVKWLAFRGHDEKV